MFTENETFLVIFQHSERGSKVSISALWRIDGLLEEKLTIKPSYSFTNMSHDFEFEGLRIFIWSYKSFNTEIPLGGGTKRTFLGAQ